MKCPKCGYHSFDHLDSCKKCGQGLIEHKQRFNLRGFFFPGHNVTTSPDSALGESNTKEQPVDGGNVNFGFDFLDEEVDPVEKPADGISLGDDHQTVNIDQPFSIDTAKPSRKSGVTRILMTSPERARSLPFR